MQVQCAADDVACEISYVTRQKDRSSGLPLMQVLCVVDNEARGFAPLPLPLAWVSPKSRLIYYEILVFKKWFLNIFHNKKKL